jgi:D-alanyl-D-alanine carboxypeptidase
MYCVPVGANRRIRLAAVGFVAVAAMLAASIDDAEARKRKRGPAKKATAAQTYNPRAASIVLDVKSGTALQESNADAIRHPASLTKIMTLYMLFEQLEAGKVTLSTRMPVSANASAEPPTKLGLKPGGTLEVEDAIKALVTKSANDAATVVAEFLGGSEAEFARQMTRKARALGMKNTVYRNAHGLPNPDQVTTAREQALLGIAIQERFPRYYRYFSTTSFTFNGRGMRNHNKLLGRVQGVDGIKTGYTRASGFNLVTSMRRGDRQIVAVVLGGASGAQRDARMRTLVEGHIMEASVRRTAPTVVADVPTVAPIPVPAPRHTPPAPQTGHQLAAIGSTPVAGPAGAAPRLGSTDPIRPLIVRSVNVRSGGAAAMAKAQPADRPAAIQTASIAPVAIPAQPEPPAALPQRRPGGLSSALPAAVAAASNAMNSTAKAADNKPADAKPAAAAKSAPRSGWAIQIGAYEAESEAKQKLSTAKTKAASVLKKVEPYTERTKSGAKTYYRARFAGFGERDEALAACKQLKRSSIQCMALRI